MLVFRIIFLFEVLALGVRFLVPLSLERSWWGRLNLGDWECGGMISPRPPELWLEELFPVIVGMWEPIVVPIRGDGEPMGVSWLRRLERNPLFMTGWSTSLILQGGPESSGVFSTKTSDRFSVLGEPPLVVMCRFYIIAGRRVTSVYRGFALKRWHSRPRGGVLGETSVL